MPEQKIHTRAYIGPTTFPNPETWVRTNMLAKDPRFDPSKVGKIALEGGMGFAYLTPEEFVAVWLVRPLVGDSIIRLSYLHSRPDKTPIIAVKDYEGEIRRRLPVNRTLVPALATFLAPHVSNLKLSSEHALMLFSEEAAKTGAVSEEEMQFWLAEHPVEAETPQAVGEEAPPADSSADE